MVGADGCDDGDSAPRRSECSLIFRIAKAESMGEWQFLYLLPHIDLREPIENARLAAVPHDDERLAQIRSREPATDRLVSTFTNQFGAAHHPSCILTAFEPAPITDFYAITAFRNCIEVSVTSLSWVRAVLGGNVPHVLWSDHFDLYPFAPSKDGRELIGRSLALGTALYTKPCEFQGQTAPHMPSSDHVFYSLDELLFGRLMQEWNRRFVNGVRNRNAEKLFRSLETAYVANRIPAVGSGHPTIHDIGVSIGLWVSAFEILSHPGNSRVNWRDVFELLGRIEWLSRDIGRRRFVMRNRLGEPSKDSNKKVQRFNLCQKLYGELYRARNDFLHGNRVRPANLFAHGGVGELTLLYCAPIVYRVALAAYLDIGPRRLRSGASLDQFEECMESARAWSDYERALLTFWKGDRERPENAVAEA